MMIMKGCLGAPHSGLTVLCKSPHRPATNRCYIDDDYDEDYDANDGVTSIQIISSRQLPTLRRFLTPWPASLHRCQSNSQPYYLVSLVGESAYPPPPTPHISYFFWLNRCLASLGARCDRWGQFFVPWNDAHCHSYNDAAGSEKIHIAILTMM